MSRSSLSGLSDRELLGRLKSLVEKERSSTIDILLHLNEVERRRLYLPLGYPSLFEYCMAHLGYSRSAAGRRIAAARCIRDYPEVLGHLEKNEMTLVTVTRVEGALTRDNFLELLSKVRGKSEREVDEVLSGYRPPVLLRDRVKPVRVAIPVSRRQNASDSRSTCFTTPSAGSEISPSAAGPFSSDSSGGVPVRASTAAGASAANASAAGASVSSAPMDGLRQPGTRPSTLHPPAPTTLRLEQRFQIHFVATEAFMKKLEKARSLLSNRLDERTLEKVFEALIDEFLAHHSPEKRQERREKRRAKKHEARKGASRATSDSSSRHVPECVRDEVFRRDEGRCTYVGTTGKRCGSTDHVQIDHVVPYARGGTNGPNNLRLLCGKHNRLEAERVYGTNVIRRHRPRE